MKTLYISDLDGTLLDKEARLSPYTINTLNTLIQKGMYFSAATARTAATAALMLSPVHINTPVVLMNGVIVYDLNKKNYIQVQFLKETSVSFILHSMKMCDLTGFMYEIKNNSMATYYETLATPAMQEFYNERVRNFKKPFIHVDNLSCVPSNGVIYFALLDTRERLARLHDLLKTDAGLKMEFYQDIYSDGLWYLEIFNCLATKYNAVSFLKQYGSFDKVIGFGDNLNDLPLFQACDEAYAVENAKLEVKKAASGIIKSNIENGVAFFLSHLPEKQDT